MYNKKNNNVKNSIIPARESLILLAGEAVVTAIVALGYYLCDLAFNTGFSYRIFTGAALGSVVVILNFFFLSLSVNRAVDRYMEIRGTREMTEEEAERFTAEQGMAIQNSIKTSYIVRTVTMLAALVLAFILDWFDPLATVIPILAFRPILSLSEYARRRFDKAPDPEKFIHYPCTDDGGVSCEEENNPPYAGGVSCDAETNETDASGVSYDTEANEKEDDD